MEYNLSAVDIRYVIISSVVGLDTGLAKEHKDSISVVEKALTFMAKNNFAYFATRLNIIEHNIEISHKRLIRALGDLRKLAAKYTGLTAKNSEVFLYKLAVELITAYGLSFSEDKSDHRAAVYPALCLAFSDTVNSVAGLDTLVFLLDYCIENFIEKKHSFEQFMKTHYYNVTKKELSGFFARTPWVKSAKIFLGRAYSDMSDMLLAYVRGQIDVLNLFEKVC